MSITVISLLVLATLCCVLLVTTMLAVFAAAARGDRDIERHFVASGIAAGEDGARPSGRFARQPHKTEATDREQHLVG